MEGLKAIDFLGSLCVLGLTLMLLLGLDFGGVIFPWSSPKVICLIVFGVVMGGLFIMTEKKYARYPLMPWVCSVTRPMLPALSSLSLTAS